jgi:SAM-dependent methyltransferase
VSTARDSYAGQVFSAQGPSVRELAVQALSSVERGYDLLAPTFDHTPFRTPDRVLDAVAAALAPFGPFDAGLDVCCGTGAGVRALRLLCRTRVTGVDFSAGMLARARAADPPPRDAGAGADRGRTDRTPTDRTPTDRPRADPVRADRPCIDRPRTDRPRTDWVRADVRAMPFAPAFDVAVSFGAFGHFLPAERPALFAQVRGALRPGGLFAFPIGAPPRVTSPWYWLLAGFDAAMRVRNLVRRPPFVMYYRTFPLAGVCADLRGAGFSVTLLPLEEFGRRDDGSPRARLVLARRMG